MAVLSRRQDCTVLGSWFPELPNPRHAPYAGSATLPRALADCLRVCTAVALACDAPSSAPWPGALPSISGATPPGAFCISWYPISPIVNANACTQRLPTSRPASKRGSGYRSRRSVSRLRAEPIVPSVASGTSSSSQVECASAFAHEQTRPGIGHHTPSSPADRRQNRQTEWGTDGTAGAVLACSPGRSW